MPSVSDAARLRQIAAELQSLFVDRVKEDHEETERRSVCLLIREAISLGAFGGNEWAELRAQSVGFAAEQSSYGEYYVAPRVAVAVLEERGRPVNSLSGAYAFVVSEVRAAAERLSETMLLSRAANVFAFGTPKELICFLDRHPEVKQERPLTKTGKPHARRRTVDVLSLVRAISRDDAIMSDPVRKAKMQSRLKQAEIAKELEQAALALLGIKTK